MRQDRTIELNPTPKFVPTHIAGDRDFHGNGPRVYTSAQLMIRNGNELWCNVFMHARETRGDRTTVVGARNYRVFSDPSISHIYSIRSDPASSAEYTDRDHSDDTIVLNTTELVKKFVVTGDTRGDEAGSRTGFTAHFNPVTIDCEVTDPGDNIVAVSVDPTPMFIPQHIQGDRDFHGNGPRVDVSARISVHNKREIWATVSMLAKETRRDWTLAAGSHHFRIYQHDRDIVKIVSPTRSATSYEDEDHHIDSLALAGGDLVRRFEVVGDTRGDEAGIRTGVRAFFNPILIEQAP